MPKQKKESKLHVKPTQEELEENIKKAEEDLEALKEEPTPSPSPEEPTPSPSEPVPSPSPSPEVPSPSPSPEVPSEEPAPSPSKEIYKDLHKREKEKRIASAQEAQVLHARNKKITDALETASQIPEPTEEEMQAEYSDWEVMSDFEKKTAKEILLANRRFAALDEVRREFKDSEAHQKKINDFVGDPETLVKYPGLEGREDEFRIFASKPTRRGVDFEDLVPAFLYNMETAKPIKKSGKMFEIGTGGPARPPKSAGKIGIEEAAQLRKTDYKKYKALLLAGKIATEEI